MHMVNQHNGQPEKEAKNLPGRKAAAYLRSAISYAPDDPQYPATREQAEGTRAYAAKYGIDIVKTYVDEGKSGLGIDERDGLRSLIADIHSGAAEYNVILMRDVTRWGREMDEGAYYEFICRRAGVDVLYVEGPLFKNDGSMLSSIVKTIKRAMLEEYKRELAAKAAGQLENNIESAETEGMHE
jgi:DNA invertase Pin-like site-specific DNA recombinase